MKFLNISRQSLPYYRMAGYTVTILMHSLNVVVMLNNFRGDTFKDPNIQDFYYFMDKFITCWTFAFQSFHAVLGLSCDILTLKSEGKKSTLLQSMKYIRKTIFDCIVVPYTFLVTGVFWPVFLYNRELLLPTFTTKIVGNISNHVMHTAILPATLWEIAFRPRKRPNSHLENVFINAVYMSVYLSVIFSAYAKKGMFPYPMLTMLYGSIYFKLLVAFFALGWHAVYFGQWRLTDFLWRRNVDKE